MSKQHSVDYSSQYSARSLVLSSYAAATEAAARIDQDLMQALRGDADGRTQARISFEIPANASVDQCDVIITATRAALVKASDAADLREALGQGASPSPAVVIDFGALRTVNAILLPFASGAGRYTVTPWLGSGFAPTALTLGNPSQPISRAEDGASYQLYRYPISETRSERLLIELDVAGIDLANVIAVMELSLPELPADLNLRINGGVPVWEQPGKVQLGTSAERDTDGWTDAGERRLPLAAALTEFTADPTSAAPRQITLELNSGVPGKLDLSIETLRYRLLHRLSFGQQDLNLNFLTEGRQQLTLQAPEGDNGPRRLRGMQLTLAADLPPERTLPPIGPAASGTGELVLGKGRAACTRLDGGKGLSELTALRLPLKTLAGSAEAHMMLWQQDAITGLPGEPLEDAISEPVNWESSDESWLSFVFTKPLPFDPDRPPWAALIVNRGRVAWRFAPGTEHPLRLGAPAGPWRALPGLFGADKPLGTAGARIRVVGHASDTAPLPPIQLDLEDLSQTLEVTPTTEGIRLSLTISNENRFGETQLHITSFTPGTLMLSEIDLITDP